MAQPNKQGSASAVKEAIKNPFKNRFLQYKAERTRDVGVGQALEEQSDRDVLAKKLVEDLGKTEYGSQKLVDLMAKNPEKGKNVAITLDNQGRYLREYLGLKEDTQVSDDFKLTPLHLLKVAHIGSANSNRGNIFKDIALVTMRDIFVLIDTIYGNSVRGATKGLVAYENVIVDFPSSSQTYDFVPAASTSFTQTGLSPAPFVKLKTLVFTSINGAAKKLIGSDDGSGNFNSTDANFNGTSSTIDYTSGNIALVFVAALTINDVVSIEWSWDAESDLNYEEFGQASLKARLFTFNPILQPLGYNYSSVAMQTFGSTGLGNYHDTLVKRIGDLHAARKDHKSFRFGRQVAAAQSQFQFLTNWKDEGSDNDWNHTQRVTETLGNIGTTIYSELQRGDVNCAVVGTKAVNYYRKHRKYEIDKTQSRVQGSYLDGYLNGVPFYVCPNIANQGLIGESETLTVYKNPEEDGEPSIVYGTFLEISGKLEFPQLYVQGTIATLEDRLLVQAKYLRLMNFPDLIG